MLRSKNDPTSKPSVFILVVLLSLGLASSAHAAMKITSLGYKPGQTGGGVWTGGNLGKTWAEGEWVPYQLVMAEVAPGLAELDSIVISFDFNVPHAGDFFRFVDLVRGIQVGTSPLTETQAWPRPDGSAFPMGSRDEIEIAQNDPAENSWIGFSLLNLPGDRVNRTLSGDLDVPPGEDRHIFKIYKSDLLAAGIHINEDTVVIYCQLHESRTFIWQNRLQTTYDAPPTDLWGGYLYGTDSWDTVSVLGSGYVPGASGHMRLENPGGGQEIPIPIPESPPGTVSGLKWRDDNGNGMQDGAEPGLSGWQVHVSGTTEGITLSSSTLTDEFGNYTFPGLTVGTWTIKEDQQRDSPAESGYSQTYPTAGIQVGQGTAVAVGPPPPDAAPVGWEVELTLAIPDQADMDFGNQGCTLDLTPPEDDSVHAADYFVSTDFTVIEGKSPATVNICGVTPVPTNQPFIVDSHVEWQTECDDDDETFDICLEAIGEFGAKDTGVFHVTVYNNPPHLTCPPDGNVEQGQTFVSNDFSATDVDNDPVTVTFLDISPSATNDPQVVDDHVEWTTTGADSLGKYTIRLIAKDHCGLSDICQFTVTVDEPTSVFECPEDDSVHAGMYFISTDFTLTHPDCDPSSVEILDISPSPSSHPDTLPFVKDSHVEWQTNCSVGDYVITLITNEQCSVQDTCSFTVTVYNLPPELTCPDYGQIQALGLFVSTDFYVNDPFGEQVEVCLLDIEPDPYKIEEETGDTVLSPHQPFIPEGERHVKWQTECIVNDFVITLEAIDPCGLADTCEFWVSVYFERRPDFKIWVEPKAPWIAAGASVKYVVEVNHEDPKHEFYEECSLFVTGQPVPPNSAYFDKPVMTPVDFTDLWVHTVAATDTGWYTLTIIGRAVRDTVVHMHSRQCSLRVDEPLDVQDEGDSPSQPKTFTLYQNQPNPFNPNTWIAYYVPRECEVMVTIYNVLGQKVRTLFDGRQGAGKHSLEWDGKSDKGIEVSSGIYLYRLDADDFSDAKKMMLIK